MKIFVVNCGSSSIKYQLFDMTDESTLARGLLERVGGPEGRLVHTARGTTHQAPAQACDHTEGMKVVLDALVDARFAVLKDIDEIDGVGHRVVHGGEQVTDSRSIDGELLKVIRRYAELAPLHNPPNLMGIEAAMAAVPAVPHVAVFDTAFLATLPPTAHRYAVPEQWYAQHHVRKYGFHGTSHRYVTLRTAELIGKDVDGVNLITVHLGNGCSMTAVAGGRAVDHSMGMTPLEGLVMGTRCGDLDPAVPLHMVSVGLTVEQVDEALNKASGLLGVSGLSNDMRDLVAAAAEGNPSAGLAVDMFVYRVVKYIGAYYTILPALDAVVLTGGIGENSVPIRAEICSGLARLGARPDRQRNERTVAGAAGPITTDDSPLPVWVVPTNEELMIARDTACIVAGRSAN
ncbi:MAG TPA: acetate kinase [Phycisphaerae bacterium]|nr:acetate kinase [Phycisphaerae bacterium]